MEGDRGSDFVQDGVTSLEDVGEFGGGTELEERDGGGRDAGEAMGGEWQGEFAQEPGEEGRRGGGGEEMMVVVH